MVGGGKEPPAAVRAREEERARLARELHDGPAQLLANLVFRLEGCLELLAADPRQAAGELGRIKELARQSLADLRQVIHDLQPLDLEEVGLVRALGRYLRDWGARTGLETALEAEAGLPRLQPEAALAVFRIVQEALSNVARHARARRATVRLGARGERLTCTVSDDGQGLPPGRRGPRGYGLKTMEARAALLGGSLSVGPAPGGGTAVTVEIPLDR